MKFLWILYVISLTVSLCVYTVVAHKRISLMYWRTKYRLHPDGYLWAELILTGIVTVSLYVFVGFWLSRHL